MDVFEAIEKRYSCREYLKRKVSSSDLILLLDAAQKAPNAGNLQNWDFIVVRDQEKKEKITKAALNQRWMMQADLFIVICADSEPSKKFYPKRGEQYEPQNSSAAAENILLMATSIGLGACWVSAFETKAVSRALKLPENITPHVIITVGHPAEEQKQKRRSSLETVTHFEEYGNKEKRPKEFLKELRTSSKSLYNKTPRTRKK